MTTIATTPGPSVELTALNERVLGALSLCEGVLRVARADLQRRQQLYAAEFGVLVDTLDTEDKWGQRTSTILGDVEVYSALERVCWLLRELTSGDSLP